MTRDSYECEKALRPASNEQQDEFWRLRGRLSATITVNIGVIVRECPEVAESMKELEGFMRRYRNRSFLLFRPEDLAADTTNGDRLCLR